MAREKDDPICTKAILELCKETFLLKDKAIGGFWAVLVLVLALCGTAIAWAISTSSTISAVQTKEAYTEIRLTKLEIVDNKLDTVLKILKKNK
jgi:F0F1-type ATP synthase membrane subunit c/vacuolar-type H+-ATPase subunit K